MSLVHLILDWLAAGLLLVNFLGVAAARERADDAYELARNSMDGHTHVADVLAEHHERLEAVEKQNE